MKFKLLKGFRGLFFVSQIFVACSTYQNKLEKTRSLMASGQSELAAEAIKEKANDSSGDQLIYLLDYGTALFESGLYKKSATIFNQADSLADINDFMSLSEETTSLLVNDSITHYRGEIFEVSLINVYPAIAYLLMGDLEKAAVECRRINYKLEKLITVGESLKKQNAFARYLSALIWETTGDWDAAYIDYHKAYEVDPSIKDIGERLLISSARAKRDNDFQRWKQKFSTSFKTYNLQKNDSEIIVFYQQGWIPRKVPHYADYRFPYMVPTYASTQQIELQVGQQKKQSFLLYDLQSVAVKTLQDKYLKLVGKHLLGQVAKRVVSDQIDQKTKGGGALAMLAMNIMDQADLRQWATLPQTFQILRFKIEPGEHDVSILSLPQREILRQEKIKVSVGKKIFITQRTYL